LERFEEKYEPEPNSGCWLWFANVDVRGYPHFIIEAQADNVITRHHTHRAHRIAYEMYRGPIPGDLPLDHLCRVPICVNPAHLEAVPQPENHRRVPRKKLTYCKRRHPFGDDNAIVMVRNDRPKTRLSRRCLTCERDRWRKAWHNRAETDNG
jgi:hypothetical protein